MVIGGPTASGKSDLALRLAERCGGVVINADALQFFRDLRILSARPSPDDEARVPHRLFGSLPGDDTVSAGRYLELIAPELARCRRDGKPAIVVGGTGLYLEALLEGIAPVPPVPTTVRHDATSRHEALGGAVFRRELADLDPVMAARLHDGDSQRLVRAYEVIVATGRSLAWWQAQPRERLSLPPLTLGLKLMPERQALRARIERRFEAMLAAGLLEEIERLGALGLPNDAPVMKAIGVGALSAHVAGELSLDAARARTIIATRQYAKRQITWFRHRLPMLQPVAAFGDGLQPHTDQFTRLARVDPGIVRQ